MIVSFGQNKLAPVYMEAVLDDFFCLYNEEKQADQADRLKSSQAILLKLLTDLAMPSGETFK